ncbi:MAG TPA: ABC-2 transporter permease [Bryobacteraceae bacterium]|nr:ABC-2 transporter permease [Bryobacteraceae bacterium]
MMIPLRALIKKDLRLFFADRRAVIMSFIAPVVIASFFGYIFGGTGGKTETSRIPVLIVDLDSSAISRGIFADLKARDSLDVEAAALDDARAAVRKGTATVGVVIPKDFGTNASRAFFRSAKKPEIGVLYDPSHAAEQSMVQGILTGSVMQVVSKEVFGGASGNTVVKQSLADVEASPNMAAGDKKQLRDLLQSVEQWNQRVQAQPATAAGQAGLSGGISVPYEIHQEAVTARAGVRYNGYAHSFGGMSVQFILFMGVDVGIGMLLMRQRGLWKRLRAAPLSRGMLLGSRALSAALISMLILGVSFTFARIAFGVRIEGSMAGFLAVCAAFSLMTAAFGLLIAALGKTPEAARGLSIFVTLILVMLGGAWVPAFIFPQWLQKVTLFVPTRWAMDGLDAMTWRGLSFEAALAPIGVLLLSATVFGLLAVFRFRWEAEGS